MGEMKIGIYWFFIADIVTKCKLSGPLSSIYFLSKPLNLVGCHRNQKAKFATNIQKVTLQKL